MARSPPPTTQSVRLDEEGIMERPKDPRDVVCTYCNRNATEAVFSKILNGAECQTCQRTIRRGKTNPDYRPPNPTDEHICQDCGNFKSYMQVRCKDCYFEWKRRKQPTPEASKRHKDDLEAWLKARRNRISNKTKNFKLGI